MKTVILDGSAANPGDLSWDGLRKFGELEVYDYTTSDETFERAKDAEICITNKTAFTREILEKLPKLRYIGVAATGYNVVDLECCRERGITVTNVPEYGTAATAQMTIALLLEMACRVSEHNTAVKNGEWVTSKQFCFWKSPLTELAGKKMTIVGFGKIGQRVAAIASALGMKVCAVPHHMPESGFFEVDGYRIPASSLEAVISETDVLTFHCPLTSETRGMLNSNLISQMKSTALVINCARGPVVNEADVASALNSGKLAGFACDVVSVEPMLPDNPLLTASNTVITPHIAWAPLETRARLIDIVVSNLEAFLDGHPVNVVN